MNPPQPQNPLPMPLSEELAPFHPAAPHPEPAEPAAHIDAVVVQIAAVVVPAEAVLVTREAPEATPPAALPDAPVESDAQREKEESGA